MATRIIVSYDDTDNDRDALALGRLLAFSGAELSLAYVVHSQGGALEQKDAEDLLARGAASVGAPDMPRHVVLNPMTSVGLAELAEEESADVIVFGSEYRTAPGTVKPGISAHKLLLGGPAAIAVAPGGLRDNPSVSVNTIGVIDEGDPAARETAEGLAAALGATVAEHGSGHVDLRRQRLRGRDGDLPGARGAAGPHGRVRRPAGGGARRPHRPGAGRYRLTTRITAATEGSRPSIRRRASDH
jgi:hypothetical protein